MIEHANNVRLRSVEVACVDLDLEPVPFNKGFYSINMTFFFDVCVDVFSPCSPCPVIANGCSIFSKRVVLYGSEGNVKMFNSDVCCGDEALLNGGLILPKASVQVAQPVGLCARLCDAPQCDCCCHVPEHVCRYFGGELCMDCRRSVYVSIGLFTIVQIVRNVQLLIPSYDFCVPQKECVTTSDNPCDMFRRIDFPTNEFFPPKVNECGTCERCCPK